MAGEAIGRRWCITKAPTVDELERRIKLLERVLEKAIDIVLRYEREDECAEGPSESSELRREAGL